MKIKIDVSFNKFEDKYKPILLISIIRMEDVISSNIFLEHLMDEISKSKGLEGELSKWKNATPQEIFNQLFPIKLNLNTYYTPQNVIGYGLPSTKEIYLNTKYLYNYRIDNDLDLMKIGSNLLHEHSHDCGFSHDFRSTYRRPNSISYVLNRAYERAFKKFYNLPDYSKRINYTPWYKRIFSWI